MPKYFVQMTFKVNRNELRYIIKAFFKIMGVDENLFFEVKDSILTVSNGNYNNLFLEAKLPVSESTNGTAVIDFKFLHKSLKRKIKLDNILFSFSDTCVVFDDKCSILGHIETIRDKCYKANKSVFNPNNFAEATTNHFNSAICSIEYAFDSHYSFCIQKTCEEKLRLFVHGEKCSAFYDIKDIAQCSKGHWRSRINGHAMSLLKIICQYTKKETIRVYPSESKTLFEAAEFSLICKTTNEYAATWEVPYCTDTFTIKRNDLIKELGNLGKHSGSIGFIRARLIVNDTHAEIRLENKSSGYKDAKYNLVASIDIGYLLSNINVENNIDINFSLGGLLKTLKGINSEILVFNIVNNVFVITKPIQEEGTQFYALLSIAEAWNDKDGIYIEYRYDTTPPPDLINKLIERHYEQLDEDSCAWPDGVIIHHKETGAKVCIKKSDLKRTISVSVAPSIGAKSLMAIIMDSMDDLHRDFQGIEVNIVIPCSCDKCVNMDYRKATVFDYYKLRQWYKEYPKKQVVCNESDTTFMVSKILEKFFNLS